MKFNLLQIYNAAPPSRRENAAAFVVAAAAAYLMLWNLDYAAFWHDEATNAIMARNLASLGAFTGWDGRNLFFGTTFVNDGQFAVDAELNLASYPPWPAVPSALGYLLFGSGEFGARFPHALLGVFCMPVFWLLLKMNFPGRPRLRLLAFSMFALSPILILYARQGRYYPDAVFFSLLCVLCYQKYWRGGRAWWLAGLSVFTVLNFLNHFAIGVSAAIAVAAWHVILHWRETPLRKWLEFSAAAVFAAAACAGWLFWTGILGGDSVLEYGGDLYEDSWVVRRFDLAVLYFRDAVRTGWLPWCAALWWGWFVFMHVRGAATAAKPKKRKKKAPDKPDEDAAAMRGWGLLAFLMFAAAALVSVQPPAKHALADMRYMVFALPFVVFMSAAFADWVWGKNKTAGAALVAVLMLSHLAVRPFVVDVVHKTIFHCPTEHFPLPALVREIHRPYPSSAAEAAAFLRRHAKQDETVFVQPWADYAVLLYYLSGKLKFCCGLKDDAELPREKIRELGAPVYESDGNPDWLVLFGGKGGELIEHQTYGVYREAYRGVGFSYPTQRPELEYRCFKPQTGGLTSAVYRRVEP